MPPRGSDRGAPPGRGGGPPARGGPPSGGGNPYTRGGGPPPRGTGPRGGAPTRGGPPSRGGPPAPTVPMSQTAARVPVGGAAHVRTVAVKRPNYGTSGRPIQVLTNTFELTCPPMTIYHYDVVINEDEKKLPMKFNLELIDRMQTKTYAKVFAGSLTSYDGRKNLYSAKPIEFPEGGTRVTSGKFLVPRDDDPPAPGGPPPKLCTITLKEVARISPETLRLFRDGETSHDEQVTTAISAMNVAIRMLPNLKYPFNIRSFFTDKEYRNVGAGLEVWRGYFQSVRFGVGRLFCNIDVATGQMFQRGPLLDLLIVMMQDAVRDARKITPQTLTIGRGGQFDDRMRVLAHRSVAGVKVINKFWKGPGKAQPKLIRRVLMETARSYKFKMKDGQTMSVLDYVKQTYNINLQYPDMCLVEVGNGARLPIEMCEVLPGQTWKRQTPSTQIREILAFSTQKPPERQRAIQNAMQIMGYGESKYLAAFNMKVTDKPISIAARQLKPPNLIYGDNAVISPADGAWNMKGKTFFRSADVNQNWWFWSLDSRARPDSVIEGLIAGAREVGVTGWGQNPIVRTENVFNRPPGMSLVQRMEQLYQECLQRNKNIPPKILVVMLPFHQNNELYQTTKYLGDIRWAIPTQCMQSQKATKGNAQYFANIMLKVNVKLGGVNVIPDRRSVPYLMDAAAPTLVIGADCIHPSPGAENRPTFSAFVSSVDTNVSKYVAQMRPQASRQEMITDMASYTALALTNFKDYRAFMEKKTNPPARIVYFRDGVSEGQFEELIKTEVAGIKEGCRLKGVNALVTAIVVGKRHHVRMFPARAQDADRSGNCPAGTVIDTEIVNPVDFDFFLQSHGGLLGTSKPAHYTVLLDESNMRADEIQQLCFSLCHVYQRSTRSVSIPAPTYYADIVCSRYKNHFNPDTLVSLETGDRGTSVFSGGSGNRGVLTPEALGTWKQHFNMPRDSQGRAMYFM